MSHPHVEAARRGLNGYRRLEPPPGGLDDLFGFEVSEELNAWVRRGTYADRGARRSLLPKLRDRRDGLLAA